MSGMCLEVSPGNELTTSRGVGESFHIDAILPNGDELNVTAEIVSVKRQRREVRLGMQFKELAFRRLVGGQLYNNPSL